ncbi:DUF433 domain-containing protein [Candidatus Entotheonella palauensis]|nr:DUF433 domain-containing protein [Candidatus Entotheonella palauensis]
MNALQKAEQLLTEMTLEEKIQLLQWIARDLGRVSPGVISTSGICGGHPRIIGTRIPVWVLVQYRKLGASEADLLNAYPTLRAEDLANAWAYYRAHLDEIERQMTENDEGVDRPNI